MSGWASRTALALVLTGTLASALEAEEGKASPGPGLTSQYAVALYGYFKFDLAFDDSRVNTGNYARWVEREDLSRDDDQTSVTANQTRLGLKFDTADRHPARTRGQVEVDFYGAAPENKAEPMMRLAFLEVEWASRDFRLLAGQSADVISPLNPPTINYTVNWWCGNIGYRRPQLRLTKGFTPMTNGRLQLEGAVARNIGHDGRFDPGDTGEDEGFPAAQGRMSLAVPLGEKGKATLGVSSHVGEDEWDVTDTNKRYHVESYSVNVDLNAKLNDRLTFQGEFFSGQNLDSYLGGVGSGIYVTPAGQPRDIDSRGGWASASITPLRGIAVNLGAGLEDPDEDFPEGIIASYFAGAYRSRNGNVWVNSWYDLTPAVRTGLEVSYWETRYKYEVETDGVPRTRFDTATNLRLQAAVMFTI